MPSALAERGFLPDYSYNPGDFIKALRWQYYGDDLRYSLKNKYNAEDNKEDLERLYSILDEIGNHLPCNLNFDIEWFIKCNNDESKKSPSLGDIEEKLKGLRDYSLTDTEQYKKTSNFIRNCQRTIKRIMNNEPIYLIPEERKDFLKLSYMLSSPPEKDY